MHQNVTVAVMRLQARLRATTSHRAAAQTEHALDLVLNQPDNRAEPQRQVRNALSEAGKKAMRRAHLLTDERKLGLFANAGNGLDGILRFELEDFIACDVPPADRPLLAAALAGGGAEAIAETYGIPVERARERLSRARARAYPRWLN